MPYQSPPRSRSRSASPQQDEISHALTHELVHAYDHCRAKNLDWTDCQHHACSEIRAAALSGEGGGGRGAAATVGSPGRAQLGGGWLCCTANWQALHTCAATAVPRRCCPCRPAGAPPPPPPPPPHPPLAGDCDFRMEVMRGNLALRAQFQKCVRRRAELSGAPPQPPATLCAAAAAAAAAEAPCRCHHPYPACTASRCSQ